MSMASSQARAARAVRHYQLKDPAIRVGRMCSKSSQIPARSLGTP
jgi:hypothetical protein